MAIVKASNSKASLANAINYITKKEKTESKLISAINCVPCTAIEEMKATKEIYQKLEGRQYKHFIHSFEKSENIKPEQAHQIARELVQEQYKDFEIIIATHTDKEHIHSHIIINSVSFFNGKKIQQSKADLEKMKAFNNELCKKYGFSVCELGEKTENITTNDINKYKAIERASLGAYKSYVLDTAIAVINAIKIAINKDDFINIMTKQGYKTLWSDTKKNITFVNQDGQRVRNSNLTKTFKQDFSKEGLYNEFRKNCERTDNKRTNARIERTKEVGLREQSIENELNRIQREIRTVENRANAITKTDTKSDDRTNTNDKSIRASERNVEHQYKPHNKGFRR